MKKIPFLVVLFFAMTQSTCQKAPDHPNPPQQVENLSPETKTDSAEKTVVRETPPAKKETVALKPEDIRLDTALLFDQYTLKDEYTYQKKKRDFNWEEIKTYLALIENMQESPLTWGVLKNYKNWNGEAPLVKVFARNRYGRIADSLGVERYQSVPLYTTNDTVTPLIYGRDGSLMHVCDTTRKFYLTVSPDGKDRWYVPKRYVKLLPDSTRFYHVVVVDRKDQNITTLERKARGHWLIRSKNPATTGRNKPPYAQPTPLGMFLIQEQKRKMVYLKDGSSARGGFAPFASRFTNGAYIHGVPVQAPNTKIIEYSWSLGTVPRSHMCVRNATSHAEFIYQWAPLRQSLVVVVE